MTDAVARAQKHVEKSSLASLCGDLEVALSELILASELYVSGIEQARTKDERRKISALFAECTEEAERIKARRLEAASVHNIVHESSNHKAVQRDRLTSIRRPHMDLIIHGPTEVRSISKKEQVILLKASKFDDRVFPIWNEDNVATHLDITQHYTDPVAIFEKQSDTIGSYVRLPESVPGATMTNTDLIIHSTLSQKVLNDCSVVASLIVSSQWSSRFRTRLITSRLYPQDANRAPLTSRSGKYMMKVFLNGTERQVVVDDLMPLDKTDDAQCILVSSKHYPQVCWPAIVEKMFLKVAGDDFNGSNAASDLRLLTGWIPQTITLRGVAQNAETLWKSIYAPWTRGDVLITLGTGKLSVAQILDSGLVSDHNYAVTGLCGKGDEMMVTIQNPWLSPSLVDPQGLSVEYKTTFELDMNDLLLSFSSIFLNWHPRRWQYTSTIHAAYTKDQFGVSDHNVYTCPQFLISNTSADAIQLFLLLSRHRSKTSSSTSTTVYSSLAIFENSGERVTTSTNPVLWTDYHGSLDLDLELSIPEGVTYTVVLIQRSPSPSESMTLTSHFDAPDPSHLVVSEAPPGTLFSYVLDGAWTTSTAGGSSPLPTFCQNPTYFLSTTTSNRRDNHHGDDAAWSAARGTRIKIVLECPLAEMELGLALTHGHERPLTLVARSTFFTNAEFRGTHQSTTSPAWLTLPASGRGTYTLTPFTRRVGECAPYRITVWSDSPLDLARAPDLGAGRVRRAVRGHWSKNARRQTFRLESGRLNRVTLHVHAAGRTSTIRVGIFSPGGVLAGEGWSAEGQGSVGLDGLQIHGQRTYTLVCEILGTLLGGNNNNGGGGGGECAFEVQVFSDGVLSLNRC